MFLSQLNLSGWLSIHSCAVKWFLIGVGTTTLLGVVAFFVIGAIVGMTGGRTR